MCRLETVTTPTSPNKYQGKEYDDEHGLNMYDFHARMVACPAFSGDAAPTYSPVYIFGNRIHGNLSFPISPESNTIQPYSPDSHTPGNFLLNRIYGEIYPLE